MKKFSALILTICMLLMAVTGCTKPDNNQGTSSDAGSVRIAIVQPMSHTSLDQIRDSIVKELTTTHGPNRDIVTLNANGDTSSLQTIFENEKAKNVDIVIPIATSAAQSAKSVFEGTDTAIVYAAVTDPVAAGLTGEDSQYITGVSDVVPASDIVKLIPHFQPNFKKIGFLYTSTETNSVSTIMSAKQYCDENSIAYEEASISSANDLESAINSLIGKGVDAFYTGNDNTIAAAMPVFTDLAYKNGIPIYCGADSMVADGGFATIGVNYVQLGTQVAGLVNKITDGSRPVELPYETLKEYATFVNLQAADKLKLNVTEDQLKGFKVLVEKDGSNHFNE